MTCTPCNTKSRQYGFINASNRPEDSQSVSNTQIKMVDKWLSRNKLAMSAFTREVITGAILSRHTCMSNTINIFPIIMNMMYNHNTRIPNVSDRVSLIGVGEVQFIN